MTEENKTNVKIDDLPKPESEELTLEEAKDVQGGLSLNFTKIEYNANTIGGALGQDVQNTVGGALGDDVVRGAFGDGSVRNK